MLELIAFVCFCLLSSSIYCLNDVIDVQSDRVHPRKKERPVASGRVPRVAGMMLSVCLAGAALSIGLTLMPGGVVAFGGAYLLCSLLYCLFLKHRVIVDVLLIAIGFVLRLLAGCAAIGVEPSSWIQVCSFSLALFLGFGKRRLEIDRFGNSSDYRRVLESYDVPKLNLLLGISASVCLTSYMLYTVAPHTVAFHGTDKLIYTVPFVAYGLFRYLFKVQEGGGDGPDDVLLKDPVFAINCLLWLGTSVGIIYCARGL